MAAKKKSRARRLASQTFCERADDYCPRERKAKAGALEAAAAVALMFVAAMALGSGAGEGSAGGERGGSAPQLKPPRKTTPAVNQGASDGTAEQ